MKLPKRTRTFAELRGYGRFVDIHFSGMNGASLDAKPFVVAPLALDLESDPQLDVVPPAFSMDAQDVQGFMDELWRIGFRPSEGTGSAGSLAATERHLKDMQTIVMHQLKISATSKAKA